MQVILNNSGGHHRLRYQRNNNKNGNNNHNNNNTNNNNNNNNIAANSGMVNVKRKVKSGYYSTDIVHVIDLDELHQTKHSGKPSYVTTHVNSPTGDRSGQDDVDPIEKDNRIANEDSVSPQQSPGIQQSHIVGGKFDQVNTCCGM